MMQQKTPHRQTRSDAALAVSMTVVMTLMTLRDRALSKPRDAGEVLEKVIIVAGMVGLAIIVINWLGPVVQRYLSRIQ